MEISNPIWIIKFRCQAKLLEIVVYNQLLYKGYDVKIGWLDLLEIGFIATKSNEATYVQVTLHFDSENTIERKFGNPLRIRDTYPKIVVTMNEQFSNIYQGITHIPICKFLMMKRKKE